MFSGQSLVWSCRQDKNVGIGLEIERDMKRGGGGGVSIYSVSQNSGGMISASGSLIL
jgi:hypothetical protein